MFQQFALLKDLPEDQIDTILAQNDLYSKLTQSDLDFLPEVSINNFINICNFVDYYQLIDIHEFLEDIRYHILINTQKVIDNINQLPLNMQHKIYNHECLPKIKCRYRNIKHISCYKFMTHHQYLSYGIDDASEYGHLELVKYFFRIGKECSTRAINFASRNGHLDVVKYLFEIQNKTCTECAIDWASEFGHLEVVKYLFEIQHQNCSYKAINGASKNGHLAVVRYLFEIQHKKAIYTHAIDYASQNGHLDVVKYLFEIQHLDCSIDAIYIACKNDHLDVVRYLIEVQNKKYDGLTKKYASKRVCNYLLTKQDAYVKTFFFSLNFS